MTPAANISTQWQRVKQPAMEFWAARNARERGMLALGMALVGLTLLYLLLIDPAVSGREQLHKTVPVLRQQVAQMQEMSQQAGEATPEQPPSAVMPATRESVEASLLRKGLKPQNLEVSGSIARVQLPDAPFSGLVAWLDEMQKTALLTVTDANIVAQAQPDLVDATLTLQQRKSE
jgi:general secretion pathway protein M